MLQAARTVWVRGQASATGTQPSKHCASTVVYHRASHNLETWIASKATGSQGSAYDKLSFTGPAASMQSVPLLLPAARKRACQLQKPQLLLHYCSRLNSNNITWAHQVRWGALSLPKAALKANTGTAGCATPMPALAASGPGRSRL